MNETEALAGTNLAKTIADEHGALAATNFVEQWAVWRSGFAGFETEIQQLNMPGIFFAPIISTSVSGYLQ